MLFICVLYKCSLNSYIVYVHVWFIVNNKRKTLTKCYLYDCFSRPCDRNLRDAELISCRLRRVEPLCRLPGSALQQLAMCGFYEDLEKGVTCMFYSFAKITSTKQNKIRNINNKRKRKREA